jgi:hypothetical protein
MIGEQQVGTPYNWGGDDTPSGYVERIGQGALAGNICTCRNYNCVVDAAAGVDCSGLVSRAWNLRVHKGTSELAEFSPPVPNPGPKFENAMRADIFLREGHHVRLFKGKREQGNFEIIVLESIIASTCQGATGEIAAEGVAECYRRIEDFDAFKLLRYRNITAGEQPTINKSNGRVGRWR